MDTFLSAPTPHRVCNTQLLQDDEQIQIMPVAICLVIFEAHMNIIFFVKVKILVLIKVPLIMLTVEPRMVSIFLARSAI